MTAEPENTQMYGRLPWLRPEEMTEEQREYYQRLTDGPRDKSSLLDPAGRLRGAFNARLLHPAVGTAIQELGAVLRFATPALTGRQRELAILETAHHEGSAYEWHAHRRTGLKAGLLPEEIAAIAADRAAETLSPEEQVTREVVRALLTERDLGDDLFARASGALGLVAVFDVLSLVGHYQHTALALRVWRVPTEADD